MKIRKNYKVKSLRNGWGTVMDVSKDHKMFYVKFENGKKNLFDENGHVFRLIHKISPETERIVEYKEM